MESLTELGKKHHTDKSTFHHYTDVYERYFYPIRDRELNILEIGVYKGGSLRMLKEYFQNANIFGMDKEPKSKESEEERIKVFTGNQRDRRDLRNCFPEVEFDIVIDDGGHAMDEQQITLAAMLPRMKKSGIYILEDLQTSVAKFTVEEISHKKDSTWAFLENIKNVRSDFINSRELEFLQQNIIGLQTYIRRGSGSLSVTAVFRRR